MPLATTAEVAKGWRPLSTDQAADAETLIAAAEAWIRDPGRRPDILDSDPTGKRVVIEVVRAALAPPAEFAGHLEYSKTVGPWAKSGKIATPAGMLAFTESHAELLGISHRMPVCEIGDPCGYRTPPPDAVLP